MKLLIKVPSRSSTTVSFPCSAHTIDFVSFYTAIQDPDTIIPTNHAETSVVLRDTVKSATCHLVKQESTALSGSSA